MWIERLALTQFRNHRALTLGLDARPVVLIGPNGAGIVAEIGELERAHIESRPRVLARDRLGLGLSLAVSPHTRIGMST